MLKSCSNYRRVVQNVKELFELLRNCSNCRRVVVILETNQTIVVAGLMSFF